MSNSTNQMIGTLKPLINLSHTIALVFLVMIIIALFVSVKVKPKNKKKAIALIELGGMVAIGLIGFVFFMSFK